MYNEIELYNLVVLSYVVLFSSFIGFVIGWAFGRFSKINKNKEKEEE